ncbi:TetR/AcrR family transcriptional regulator [Vagococcus sp. BWB3-3]|uniref:TetR/AcrR family transcriptional regulator n=1 Tax=Vagococcus allomyrinae TaxID=2794353 RepID=A0A940PEL5_9ENTE|nr:TetR/AcrR family transcriptional regulator [Vagococcus allomyrinae]MBP1043172.1 TetR/AcrR family transcriptional regulator [Vagococcus allomyrinae]
MARNKYPEETEKKILDVAETLFLGNGYDQTTIQDIIDRLGGLTKGVIYHHFKSKKDIFDKVLERKYGNEVTLQLDRLTGLTGFQKIKELSLMTMRATDHQMLAYSARTLLTNPQIVGDQYKTAYETAIPLMKSFIDEGVKDGSIETDYPQEVAELIVLSTNIWLAPLIYELSQAEVLHKLYFFQMMYEGVNFPLIDQEYIDTCLMMHEVIMKKMN